MKKSRVELVIAIALCIAALAGYWWWYGMLAGETGSLAILDKQVRSRDISAIRAAAARTTFATLAGEQALVQGYFVAPTDIPSFLERLAATASTTGASLQTKSVGASGTKLSPTLTIALHLTGTFDQVLRAVGAIEEAPYALTVSAVSVTQAKQGWQADLVLVVGSSATSADSVPDTIFVPPEPPIASSSPSTSAAQPPEASTTSATSSKPAL